MTIALGNIYRFNHKWGDDPNPDIVAHENKVCTVTDRNIDGDGMTTFRIEFDDGFITEAFPDELQKE